MQAALDRLSSFELPSECRAIISNIALVTNELLLREDRQFFLGLYQQGRALLEEGASIADGHLTTAAREPIALPPATVPEEAGTAWLDAQRTKIAAALARLVPSLTHEESASARIQGFLRRLIDWENQLYQFRLSRAKPAQDGRESNLQRGNFTAESLKRYLEKTFPARAPITVTSLKTLAGGFSKTTVMFDAQFNDGRNESLVVRAEQPLELLFLDGARVDNEFHVLKLACAAGHAVAEPLWLEADATALGRRFLVSRKAVGRNFGSRIEVTANLPEELLRDLIGQLIRIHRTPLRAADEHVQRSHLRNWLAYPTLTECVTAQVRYWKEGARRFDLPPSPLLERGLEWLARNVPRNTAAPSLLHGDYGLHNILIENDRLTCVLDWEGATLGDPAEDLVWLIDGLRSRVERSRILDIHAHMSGERVPAERLRYFEVFNSIRFAVVCPRALQLFEAHPEVDIGSCELGLRFTYFGTQRMNESIALAEGERSQCP
jgi:aminoglycoside phosphotransferase (APT) family kinase protein